MIGLLLFLIQATGIDTTFAVAPNARLQVEASAGRITVRTWDRGAVRVDAMPRSGTTVSIDASDALVSVRGNARGGIDEAQYALTVPRGMALALGSGDVAIEVSGTEGDVIARNHSGAIIVSGARGSLSLKSVLGEISIRQFAGSVNAQSTHAPVRLTDVTGGVTVESSSQHLYLTRVISHALSASTIGGAVWFSGPLFDDGRYSFVSHSGSLFLTLSEPVNATVNVSTMSGGFTSAFPGVRREGTRRGRFSVRIGTGAAAVDLETFSGGVVLKPFEASRPE